MAFLLRSNLRSGFRNIALAVFLISLKAHRVLGDDSTITLADRLGDYQSYNDAITEYKRFIFLNPSDSKREYCFYKIGLSFRAIGNWAQACESFRMALATLQNDSLKDDTRIDLAITLMASGNYNLARYELLKVIHFSEFKSKKHKALFFQGVNDLYLFDWNGAYSNFQFFFSGCEQPDCRRQETRILPLLSQATSFSSKSPGKAKILSTFVPGLGQAYVGDYWHGLNALILNSLIATLTVYSVRERKYFDMAICSSLFVRYFLGNRENAKRLAENHNLKLNRERASEILKLLSSD